MFTSHFATSWTQKLDITEVVGKYVWVHVHWGAQIEKKCRIMMTCKNCGTMLQAWMSFLTMWYHGACNGIDLIVDHNTIFWFIYKLMWVCGASIETCLSPLSKATCDHLLIGPPIDSTLSFRFGCLVWRAGKTYSKCLEGVLIGLVCSQAQNMLETLVEGVLLQSSLHIANLNTFIKVVLNMGITWRIVDKSSRVPIGVVWTSWICYG